MKYGLLSFIMVAALTGCVGFGSGLTGAAIPTVPVQRMTPEGDVSKPFLVAASDVIKAESQPTVVHGLYNAGQLAQATSQVIRSGK